MRYSGGWFDDDDFSMGHHWGMNRTYGHRRHRHYRHTSLLGEIIELICDLIFGW